MATVDAPAGDSAPVKKSLRSKRLMRPAKSKTRKASDATQAESKDSADGELDASKTFDLSAQTDRRGSTGASWDADALDDTDKHSGTDADTLSVGNRNSTYSNERHSALLNGLPSVDKSASSGTTHTSSSLDVFMEASDAHADADHQSPHQQPQPEPAPMADIIDLATPTDGSRAADDKAHANSDEVDDDSSGQQFMQMLSAGEPRSRSNSVPRVDVSAPQDSGEPGTEAYDTGFMDSLVDSYGQAEPNKEAGETHDYTLSFGTSVTSPLAQSPADTEAITNETNQDGPAVGDGKASVSTAELESEHAKLGNHINEADRSNSGSGREYGLGRSSSLRQGSRTVLSPDERRRPSEAVSPASTGSKKGNRRSIMLTSFVPPVGMSGGGSSNASRSSHESPSESINEAPIDHSAMNGVVEISAGGRTFKRSSILDSQLGNSRRSSNRISQDMGMASIRLRPSAEVASAGSSQAGDVKSVAKTALQSISERFGGSSNSAASADDDDAEDDDMPEWMKEVQRRKREARKQEEAAMAARAAAEAAEAAEEEAAEAAKVEAARIEAAKAEAVKTEAAEVEAAKLKAAKLKAAKLEAAKLEAAKLETARAEAAKAAEQAMATPVSLRSHEINGSAYASEPGFELAAATVSSKPNTGKPPATEDDDDDMPLTDIDLGDRSSGLAANTDKPLPSLAPNLPADKQAPPPPQSGVSTRSIYRSLSASLGISQASIESEAPARQSGPPMPTLAERQRSTSQTASSPTPSQTSIFAAVTSFFGRNSTQQSAPPSARESEAAAPPAMYSTTSSSSNMSRGTIEFPGMRPSGTEARQGDGGDPAVDMLLQQLEEQNKQIMKDNKARVFGEAEAVERDEDADVDWDFWGNLINNYDHVTRTEPRKLARSVYRGIPKAVRGTVWQLMTKSRSDPALGARFRRLVAQRTEADSEGARHEKQIRHDLARTFPKLDYFRDADGAGQEGLFNVLRAYALFDPEVGYCQGLSFVVGPLLLNMPDEEAFCLLVKLMYTYGLRGHFLPTMDDLQLRLYQFEHVLADALPWLARHFQEQGVLPTMYVSQWLMTMFAYRLPIELTFRLFDVVFAEGLDCLLRVAIAVLKRSQTRLLSLEFEAILQYLNDGPLFAFYSHAAPDMMVRDSNQVSLNARLLQRLRRQYIEEMQRKLAEEDESNKLRTEHEQLKQECAQLRSTLEELKQSGGAGSRQSLQLELDKQRDENQRLAQTVSELELRIKDERSTAEAQLKADMDQLAQKNVQLTIKNQQLEDGLQDMEEALVQIKMLYAESENQRELMTAKFENLKKALT